MPWLFKACGCESEDSPTCPCPPAPDKEDERNPPPLSPPDHARIFVALFDYQARTDEDLSFRAGDKLEVLDKSQESWWVARLLVKNGFARPGHKQQGYVPANYVAPDQSIEAEP